ncbi:MAG: undecaprenyl-diphosphate phosphatase [Pseudothermotoga sp.]|uniref:undecaprenyl-diphosphate phosphatase n=1 Tax=Pseudothermotoga sp. TaxID=2033661 RepID=UPI000E8F85BD|nr:undecaprenyl-diphosphate phosphatase [Pseudothermotoga sp.]HBT39881.1 undecaprenyl-diphosphate phosphatase [Pseudothermotoga sp.]HCO97470.1 undecaprenyl-diphosphate phosphatase [Pseudothermotoga sp.]
MAERTWHSVSEDRKGGRILNQLFLAALQGATEFLPVSSSGHLLLFSNLLQVNIDLQMVVMLHAGSLLAIVLLVYRGIFRALKNWRILINLLISTLPAMLVGLLFEEQVESVFSSLSFLPFFFIVTAVFLLLASLKDGDRSLDQMSPKHALLIGLFQAIAVLPGVSRSGMVLSAALLLDYRREESVTYTFLMAIPVLLGASLLKLGEASLAMNLAFLVSFLSSLLALVVLKKVVLVRKLRWFAYYCLFIAFLSFLLG